MDKLRYKGFVWPQNPEHYRMESKREPAYTLSESGLVIYGGLGPRRRVVTGSGCFQSSGAYDAFLMLYALTEEETAGELVHPVWGTMTAYLMELNLEMEPREDYVAYSFVFREPDENGEIPK